MSQQEPALLSARQRANALRKKRAPNDPVLIAARRDHAAARLESYVKKVVDQAPPLTAVQRKRIAELLGGAK